MEAAKKTAKTVLVVMIINLLSRALALFANALITAYFGATSATSSYSFALSVTNIITTIIGTALTTAVIPIYLSTMEEGGKKRADEFINNTLSLTVLIGLALMAVGMLLAPYIANLSTSGDKGFSLYAIRMMMPAIIFISVGFIFSGVLQAKGDFYSPAMISLPSSIINILYIVVLSGLYGMHGLVVATLTGFLVQALYLVWPMVKKGFRFFVSFHYNNPDIRRIFKLTGPVIIGVAAYQINMLTNNSIAYSFNSEKFIILSNMQNLGIQIVLTLVLASTSVIYPKLTACAVKKDYSGFATGLHTAVNTAVLILVPLSVGFWVLSYDIVDVVYGYGKFGPNDVAMGAQIFSLYAIAVLGIGLKEICDRAYYSLNNTKTPAYNGVLIMAVNIVLSVILVRIWGFNGIAFAYSVAALIGGFTVYTLVMQYIKQHLWGDFFKILIKSALAAAVMFLCIKGVVLLEGYLPLPEGKLVVIAGLLVKVAIGVLTYFITLYLLRTKEVSELLTSFGLKKAKQEGDTN